MPASTQGLQVLWSTGAQVEWWEDGESVVGPSSYLSWVHLIREEASLLALSPHCRLQLLAWSRQLGRRSACGIGQRSLSQVQHTRSQLLQCQILLLSFAVAGRDRRAHRLCIAVIGSTGSDRSSLRSRLLVSLAAPPTTV